MKNSLKMVAVTGLVLGAVLGMLGSFVAQPNLRASCWAIDATGLVVATAILALRFFRAGNDAVAAGFLVFSIGEAVMLTGTAGPIEASVTSFAAGTALWSAALLLISIPSGFALWIRLLGIVSAILFAITSGRIFWGEQLLPIARPLPSFAYPFLVFTFCGWIWTLLREE